MITAFVDGTVFIGDGRVMEKTTVVVEDGRISRLTRGEVELPPEAEKISLDGGFLMPGLIDCHVHLCLDASADPMTAATQESRTMNTIKAIEFARQTLMGGVTTIRDLGCLYDIVLGIRDAVSNGLIEGPRILSCARLICMTGGHGWPIGREADGPDQVRQAAREQIKAGADVIKVMATGGVMTLGADPGCAQFTEEEMRSAVEEAHKAGRKTATHAMGTEGVLNAIRAGIDSIEHGVFLNQEAVDLMAEKQVFFVPTFAPLFNIEKYGIDYGVPPYMVAKSLRTREPHLKSFDLAREAGVRIAMGTDAGTPFNRHGENAQELTYMVERGFTPSEALVSATSTAARLLGLENEIGMVKEGQLADLIVVRGNPLEDINVMTGADGIPLVMIGGRIARNNWS